MSAISDFSEQATSTFFDCAHLTPESWANGGGSTRTIAHGSDGEWRVSLAELSGAAKFSQFAGFDRTLTLLDEGAVDLRFQDGELLSRAGQPVHFPGDLHVWVTPQSPANVLNVMTKRDTCRSRVSVATHSSRITCETEHILFCIRGRWLIEGLALNGLSLHPYSGIWLRGRIEHIDLRPLDPEAKLVSVAINSIDAR